LTATLVPIDANKPAAGSMLEFALRYAGIGWHVFPCWWIEDGKCACGVECKSPGKHPIGPVVPNGGKNATTDAASIRRWWGRFPRAHIAVELDVSGLCAIDIDPRNGGLYTIEAVEAEHGPLQSDVLQFSGGGGEHRVFRAPPAGTGLPGKLGAGVDVKLDGYIILEPSGHKSGGQYGWEASSSPLDGVVASVLPNWLRDLRRAVQPIPTGVQPAAFDAALAAEFADALPHISPDDRDGWLAVGMALHNELGGGQVAFDLWSAWARTSPKFDAVDQMRVWRSFKPAGLAGIGRGTVFRMAQEHGWLNPGPAVVISEPISAADAPLAVLLPPADVPHDLLTIPGALGDVVAWINASARKPQPLFAVQAALALGSIAAGRRYCTDNGNWPAMYFLNVGPSGCGKEHAKYAVEAVLEASGFGKLIGVSRFASESGLLSSLLDKPAQFSTLDEFGKFLQACTAPQNYADRNTIKGLLEVWGRADGVVRPTAYSTAGISSKQADEIAARLVRKPSLTLLALSTPQTLFAGLSTDAVADGFLNRFLTVHADHGRQLARQVPSQPIPQRVVDWVQHLRTSGAGNLAAVDAPHDVEPSPIVLGISRAAAAAFRDYEKRLHARMDELEEEGLSEMLMRSCEVAMRLALVVSLSQGRQEVTPDAAAWAIQYVDCHGERNLLEIRTHLADGTFDALCKAVVRIAAKAGAKGVTERDLGTRCRLWRGASPRMQQETLGVLQRQDRIGMVTSPSGRGRPRKAYVALSEVLIADSADKTLTPTSAPES
jgi:hypothetical protein